MNSSNQPLSPTSPLSIEPNPIQSQDDGIAPDFIEITATLPLSTTGSSATAPTIEATPSSGLWVAEDKGMIAGISSEQTTPVGSSKKQQSTLAHIIYLSAATILGASLRVYLDRLFGGDCEDYAMDVPQDFLTPASKQICVTSNGRSEQTGGALFRDLPANLLGSFVMGLVSFSGKTIPWLSKDHPIQQDDLFHLMISTGFCGSLTTFASWNTQMVVMMDGTITELGSQIVVALFGYLIGFMMPIAAFSFGRQVGSLLYTWKEDSNQTTTNNATQGEEEIASDEYPKQSKCCSNHHLFKLLFLFASLVVVALFLVGHVIYEIAFYQKMVLILPLAPLGALARWKLSRYNSPNHRTAYTQCNFHWFPYGTWTANFLGATCSIACTAVLDRWKLNGGTAMDDPWSTAVLFAVATGFGGSLSTVSSMVKEIVSLAEATNPIRAHVYAILTFVSAMLMSLIIYSITIRME